ncbi:MAG: hypothetical protein ACRET1_00420 [Burkholderiales bacterium]
MPHKFWFMPGWCNWVLAGMRRCARSRSPAPNNRLKYADVKACFDNMIPVIELPMQTCLDRGCRGQTTGYIAPRVIWLGHYFQ